MAYNQVIDPIIQKWTSLDTTNPVPHIIAAIVTKDDGLVYLNAAGAKSITNQNDKVNVDSTLAFYSTSKAITTTALLQLVENGQISSIDDPVDKYVPEIKEIKVIDSWNDKTNTPNLVEPKTKPTIRHLLTHTSGFSYSFFSHDYAKLFDATGRPNILKAEWEQFTTPLRFHPGENWHYGVSTDWVGKVVQSVSGKTLDEYVKDHIFKPIGADSLSFRRTPEHFKNHAIMHQRKEFTHGDVEPLDELHPEDPSFHPGGHGIFGKLRDYMKFLEIYLHEGTSPATGAQILKPETVRNYSFANLLPKGVSVNTSLEHSQPQFSNYVDLFDHFSPDQQSWTANFHKIDVDLPTGRSAGSVHWAGLPNLYYWVDPVKGIAGFLATQLFPFYDASVLKANAEFETAAYKLLEEGNKKSA